MYKVQDLTTVLLPAKPYYPRREGVHYIVVHHTAGPSTQTASDIHKYHIRLGWSGIGYHYLIRDVGSDGLLVVEKVRPVNTVPACVQGRNSPSVCVAFVGNFSQTRPDPIVVEESAKFIADLCQAFSLGWRGVLGHREMEGQHTICPGALFDMQELRDLVRESLHKV